MIDTGSIVLFCNTFVINPFLLLNLSTSLKSSICTKVNYFGSTFFLNIFNGLNKDFCPKLGVSLGVVGSLNKLLLLIVKINGAYNSYDLLFDS